MSATKAQIERSIKLLNKITGQPAEPWSRDTTGKYQHNVGNYSTDWGNGGVKLVQATGGGGETDVLPTGYETKPIFYLALTCFINGIQAHQEIIKTEAKAAAELVKASPWIKPKEGSG